MSDEKRLESMVARLARRTNKVAQAMLIPFPLSAYGILPPDGIVFRHMFPAKGKLLKGCVYIESLDKSGAQVTAALQGSVKLVGQSQSLRITKPFNVFDLGIPVEVGDRLSITIDDYDPTKPPGGVWISMLWLPEVGTATVKQFLVDELDKAEEKFNAISDTPSL